MRDSIRTQFQNSLDLTSDDLENFIPYLLKGLWELGSMPQYTIELFVRNQLGDKASVLDLGCGKGAVLVKLAERFNILGMGIDIVPEFIDEANSYAASYSISGKVRFKIQDIREAIQVTHQHDIVIFGYDSEILGDLKNTLRQLKSCIKPAGHIILEFMYGVRQHEGIITDKEMVTIIEQSHCVILDRIDWDKETLKQVNQQNTFTIAQNIKQLIIQYKDKEKLFHDYLQNQVDQCEDIESNFICTTILLQSRVT